MHLNFEHSFVSCLRVAVCRIVPSFQQLLSETRGTVDAKSLPGVFEGRDFCEQATYPMRGLFLRELDPKFCEQFSFSGGRKFVFSPLRGRYILVHS